MNNAQFLERRAELSRLLESVEDRLPREDRDYVADFIEANEYALALEWVVDAFAEEKRAFTRDEIERIEALAKKMNMYPAILDHYPNGLTPRPT